MLKNLIISITVILTLSSCITSNIENINNQISNPFKIKVESQDKAWMPVAFQSQFDTGKNSNNWCCGISSVNMATSYLYGKNPSSDYLKKMYQYLGKNSGCSGGTTQDEQLKVAKDIGNAKNSYNKFMTFDQAKALLKSGNPIVVGLKYSYIKNKCSSFNGYHTVTLIGYNATQGYWVVNDPLCLSPSYGLNKKIPSAEFRNATEVWASANGGKTSGYIYGTVIKK